MAKVYADLIIEGLKTLDDVPLIINEKVKKELIKRGREDLIKGE